MRDITADAKAIFLEALDRNGEDERMRFLDQACGADANLRARVEELMRAHRDAGAFLGGDEVIDATHDQPAVAGSGTVIGPYKLLEQVGEGGMGTVWMAQQTGPVKRVVALKLIKAGMDSKQVIARFEAERQALALMDHTNIARVLDAGTTSTGRPYFVMDLVKGVPITKHCDDHRFTTRQRLELFIPVCHAIQHAHQKGIIHRDLKPSNVLVAQYDGRPVPKVIDFGVAKAAGQALTNRTLVTGFGAILGTPEYMSPEQAEINQLDIDTRSDIYTLGVLLYELLAGSPPFSKKDLEKAGMLEMLRVIREQQPSRPSTKLSTAAGLPTLAANRGTEPAKLTKLMRGELDWIVMKALEKDRARRYETANGFAMDVQCYLAGEAVLAVPPSAGYRLRKFVRRNKVGVAATAAAVLVALSAVAGLTVGNVLISREKDQTAAALEQSRDNEKAYKAQLLRADENLRLAIDRGGATVVNWGYFCLYPYQTFHQYLLPEESNALRQSLQVFRAFMAVNGNPPAERAALLHLAFGDYGAAEEIMRSAIVRREGLAEANPTVVDHRWLLVDDYLNLAEALEKMGRLSEAELAYRQSLRLAAELLDRWEHFKFATKEEVCGSMAWGHHFLGRLLHRTGRASEAESAFRQALVFADRVGPEIDIPFPEGVTIDRVRATNGLGRVFQSTGRLREAEDAYRWVGRMWEHLLTASPGNRHYLWNVAAASHQLGEFFQATGRGKEAGEAYRRTLKVWEDLTAQYPTVPGYARQLAWFLACGPVLELRNPARAATLAGKATELAPNDDHNWTTLAAARYRTGNWSEAQVALEKAMYLRPWGEGLDWFLLAMIRWRAGDKPDALRWYDKAVEWMAKNDAYSDELRRLKVEAAELLGLTKK